MEKKLIRIILILWVLEMAAMAASGLLKTSSSPALEGPKVQAMSGQGGQTSSDRAPSYQLSTRTSQPSPNPAQLPPTWTPTALPSITPTPQATTTPTSTPLPGRPIRLQIPAIDIDTIIEPVGLTDDNEMSSPAARDTVGWFELGYRPGMAGSAVLTGHLDTNTGAAAVFWRLDELAAGHLILIETETGETLNFQVQSVAAYPYDQAPLDEIFGAASSSQLSLVTCSGAWDRQTQLYDQRLVVYAQLTTEMISP